MGLVTFVMFQCPWQVHDVCKAEINSPSISGAALEKNAVWCSQHMLQMSHMPYTSYVKYPNGFHLFETRQRMRCNTLRSLLQLQHGKCFDRFTANDSKLHEQAIYGRFWTARLGNGHVSACCTA